LLQIQWHKAAFKKFKDVFPRTLEPDDFRFNLKSESGSKIKEIALGSEERWHRRSSFRRSRMR
jgi:hypothetical protein